MESAPVMEKYLDYAWCERMNIPYHAHLWIKQCLIYGYSPAKVTWKKNSRKTKMNMPINIFGMTLGYLPREVEQVLYNAPKFDLIDIFDFWIDPVASGIEDARYVIQRSYLTKEELEQKEEEGLYRNVKLLIDREGANADENKQKRLSSIGLGGGQQRYEGLYQVDEYWEDNRLIAVGDGEILLHDGDNPYWHGQKPFVELIDQPIMFETYSIGEIEPIEYLQSELNTLRNMRMDNLNMSINRMWVRRRNADIDDADLISKPNGIVDVDDINSDIRELQMTPVNPQAYQEDGTIKRDMENATGVFDHTRGAQTGTDSTATEVIRLQNSAEARFYEKVMLMEAVGFKRLAHLTCSLAQQFVVNTEEIPLVTGDETQFMQVDPTKIAGQYDYITVSSSMDSLANKDVKRQSLMTLHGVIRDSPFVNMQEFTKLLFKAFEIREIDSLLLSPEQLQQMMIQQQPPEAGAGAGANGQAGMTQLGNAFGYQPSEGQMEGMAQDTVEGMMQDVEQQY
jgi:hypothetical protein